MTLLAWPTFMWVRVFSQIQPRYLRKWYDGGLLIWQSSSVTQSVLGVGHLFYSTCNHILMLLLIDLLQVSVVFVLFMKASDDILFNE